MKWEIKKKRKWEIKKKRKWEIKKIKKKTKNDVVKNVEIKEWKEKPKEIKSPEENKNTMDYFPN